MALCKKLPEFLDEVDDRELWTHVGSILSKPEFLKEVKDNQMKIKFFYFKQANERGQGVQNVKRGLGELNWFIGELSGLKQSSNGIYASRYKSKDAEKTLKRLRELCSRAGFK